MATRATSSFDVTGWEPTPYDEGVEGPQLFRVKVSKAFRGDLTGESKAELLMCINDPKDLAAGAGYVVSERVVGQLAGKSGSFIVQHWGVSGAGRAPTTAGHIVPGSGTGQLAGLVGSIEISQDAEKKHTLVLDYEFV
jgi:hypothetical protein